MSKTPSSTRIVRHFVTAVFGLLVAANSAVAQTVYTWNGSSGANWNSGTNWTPNIPGGPNGVNEQARFDFISTGSTTPTLTFGINLHSMVFTSNANAYTIGGGFTIQLNNAAGITSSAANNQLISVGNIQLNTSQSWTNNGTGTLTINSPVNLQGHTLTVTGSGPMTLGGVLSGSGGLTKAGTGTVTLNGASTYGGATNVNGGTLLLGGDNRLPTGTALTIGSSGTLNLNNFQQTVGNLNGDGLVNLGSGRLTANGTGTFGGSISGSGGFTKGGSGLLTLSGSSTYTGSTFVTGGTLSINADDRLGAAPASPTAEHLVVNNAVLQTTASFTLDANRGIALGPTSGSGTGTFEVATGTTLTYAGIMANNGSGTGGLVKTGSGTLVLGGDNTFSGPTLVNAGTLSINADERLGVAPGSPTAGHLVLNGGVLHGTADFVLNENRGIAVGPNTGSGSGTISVADGFTVNYDGVIANNGSGVGSLVKAGDGTLVLSGANTYSGSTTINGGTLLLGADNTLPTTTGVVLAAGGTLDISNRLQTITNLDGDGTLDLGNGSLTVTGTGTFGGTITGAGNLVTAPGSDLTVTGTNNSTGLVEVSSNSTLNLGSAEALNANNQVNLAGGTLRTEGGPSVDSYEAGPLVIIGSGSVIDLEGVVHTLLFNGLDVNLASTSDPLVIDGWTGVAYGEGTNGQLLFSDIGSDPNADYADFLTKVHFSAITDFAVSGAIFIPMSGGTFQLIPAPEPSGILGCVAAATAGLGLARRVRRGRQSL
jgi:fibronectin-binding autotransporter adhesin